MRPEQERVKNLLSDTVTLLCKNGLTYKTELRVEAVIGITLDNSDVFIVHINDSFDCKGDKSSDDLRSPVSKSAGFTKCESQPELVNLTEDEMEGFDEVRNEIAVDKRSELNTPTPQGALAAGIDEPDVVIKVEDDGANAQDVWGDVPALKSPGAIAHQALMIAGQRRVLNPQSQKRPYTGGSLAHGGLQQHDADAMRQTYSSFNLSTDAGKNNGRLWDAEPPTKRQSLDDYYLVPTDQGDMSAQMLFDPNTSSLFSPDGSRVGCSSWSSGGTPTLRPAGLQSDMVSLGGGGGGGGGGEARYPTLSGLQSHTHRQLLASHLVDPVLHAGSQMCAFRLSWYGKAGCDLHSAWADIVAHQRRCDLLVTSFPGIAVVGSAFTGTVSGLRRAGRDAGGGGGGPGRRTYPGLAYVVVPDGENFVYPNLLRRMERSDTGGVMKPMLGLHEQTRAKLCSALYLVFKDNVDNGYVQRMVDASAELHDTDADPGRHYPMVRFSVRGDDHWTSMSEAHAKLQESGFRCNLDRLDEDPE